MSEWQAIDSAPLDVRVLVVDRHGRIHAAIQIKERWFGELKQNWYHSDGSLLTGELTHWMSQPEKPFPQSHYDGLKAQNDAARRAIMEAGATAYPGTISMLNVEVKL